MSHFPFDWQNCSLRFLSLAPGAAELRLRLRGGGEGGGGRLELQHDFQGEALRQGGFERGDLHEGGVFFSILSFARGGFARGNLHDMVLHEGFCMGMFAGGDLHEGEQTSLGFARGLLHYGAVFFSILPFARGGFARGALHEGGSLHPAWHEALHKGLLHNGLLHNGVLHNGVLHEALHKTAAPCAPQRTGSGKSCTARRCSTRVCTRTSPSSW